MLLTETHIINENNPFYKEIDNLCFLSKNLYNFANYLIRQEFINSSKLVKSGELIHANYFNYYYINKLFIKSNQIDYISLPRKVSNQTLRILDNNWRSFFNSIKDWKINPGKYNSKPSLPYYLNKTNGRFVVRYELGAISLKELKNNKIKLSGTNIIIPFINNKEKLKCVRLVPLKNKTYKIEVIYDKKEIDLGLDKANKLGIDIGVNNLMALTSTIKGFIPKLINGRDIKSYNQYCNKEIAKEQSKLAKECNEANKKIKYSNERIEYLWNKRNNKVNDYMHKATRMVVNLCIENNMGEVVIGWNKDIKKNINIGDKNNQNFVDIPFKKIIDILKYKLKLLGISCTIVNESYTSVCSFIDLEKIGKHEKYMGKREYRGLFISNKGKTINADINGSYNIIRKVYPEVFAEGVEGFAVNPIKIRVRIH